MLSALLLLICGLASVQSAGRRLLWPNYVLQCYELMNLWANHVQVFDVFRHFHHGSEPWEQTVKSLARKIQKRLRFEEIYNHFILCDKWLGIGWGSTARPLAHTLRGPHCQWWREEALTLTQFQTNEDWVVSIVEYGHCMEISSCHILHFTWCQSPGWLGKIPGTNCATVGVWLSHKRKLQQRSASVWPSCNPLSEGNLHPKVLVAGDRLNQPWEIKTFPIINGAQRVGGRPWARHSCDDYQFQLVDVSFTKSFKHLLT